MRYLPCLLWLSLLLSFSSCKGKPVETASWGEVARATAEAASSTFGGEVLEVVKVAVAAGVEAAVTDAAQPGGGDPLKTGGTTAAILAALALLTKGAGKYKAHLEQKAPPA